MRRFSTAGPVRPDDHYAIPPLDRMDVEGLLGLVRAKRDCGVRGGLTTEERRRLKELEREVRELCRANEILRKAPAYFAQAELDRRAR